MIRKLKRLISLVLVGLFLCLDAYGLNEKFTHFEQPAMDERLRKLEGDLNREVAYVEEHFQKTGALYEDAGINRFINALIAQDELGLDFTPPTFHIRVIRDPDFNAFAVPSGGIYLNTGFLSQVNSDELRFVLAHEMMHVIGRDSVAKLSGFKDQTTVIKLFNLALLPAAAAINVYTDFEYSKVLGLYADLARIGGGVLYVASVMGYSREHETRADHFAARLVHRNGYDIQKVYDFFERWSKRDERYVGKRETTYFYMSHESYKDRLGRLKEYFGELGAQAAVKKVSGELDAELEKLVLPIKKENAALNLKLGRFQHALDVLENLTAAYPNDHEAWYLLGETYRLMAEDRLPLKDELDRKYWKEIEKENEAEQKKKWEAKAAEYFEKSLGLAPDFADAHKGLGALLEKNAQNAEAATHYKKYLEIKPNAKDKRFYTAKINGLTRKTT